MTNSTNPKTTEDFAALIVKAVNNHEALVTMVSDLKKALSRMIDKHDPDTIEAEWIGHAHELIKDCEAL